MALYRNTTPLYYGEAKSYRECKRRNSGFLAWIGDLLGFPKSPCYQPPAPPEPCPECPPCVDECPPDLCPPND